MIAAVFRTPAVAFLVPAGNERLELPKRPVNANDVSYLLTGRSGAVPDDTAALVAGSTSDIGYRLHAAIERERIERERQREAGHLLAQAALRDLPRIEQVLAAHPDELPELATDDRAGLRFQLNHAAALIIRREANDALYALDRDDEGVLRLGGGDDPKEVLLLTADGQRHAVDADRASVTSE